MISLPLRPKIIKAENNNASFEIRACYPGYGISLGTSLRRVLLSSLPGAAITGIKIKGVQHEFSTVPHVIEDVVQIILNLKQVRFKLHTDRPIKISLKAKGEKEVKAKDIKITSELEVINKDAHIAFLTDKKADLEMEIDVEPGLGYSPIEQRKKEKLEIGKIAIDAIFSPVRRVNYSVEHMRVGKRTDFDRLVINIETDGTITPKEAFFKAAQILVDHFKVFTSLAEEKKKAAVPAKTKANKIKEKEKIARVKAEAAKKEAERDVARTKIEDLKISSRTATALSETGIKTVSGLVRKSGDDLKKIEGLGEKSIIEIKRALGKLGLTLR